MGDGANRTLSISSKYKRWAAESCKITAPRETGSDGAWDMRLVCRTTFAGLRRFGFDDRGCGRSLSGKHLGLDGAFEKLLFPEPVEP